MSDKVGIGDVVLLNEDTVSRQPDSSFVLEEPGHYVVESARWDGGGYGHGPGDYYPDAWCVTARKLMPGGLYDPKGMLVSFSQLSSMRNDIGAVPVYWTMEKRFV